MLAGKIRAPEGLDPATKDSADVTRRRDQVLAQHGRARLARPSAELDAARWPSRWPCRRRRRDRGARPGAPLRRVRQAGGQDASTPSAARRATRSTQLFTGGYTIETTLDPKVFDATVGCGARASSATPGDPITAAATVEPGDGAIRSLFGGLDFAHTQFDMSSLGGRQPGSSFKPFVYLAALRTGIDPR